MNEIIYVKKGENGYPENLTKVESAPEGIYLSGKVPAGPTIYLTGARFCSSYGRYMAKQLAADLAIAGYDIVNALSMGIEGIALQSALRTGSPAYAVMVGSGLANCYPQENRLTFEELKESGGILSEHSPETIPTREKFENRHNILVGMCDAVLIVEARRHSGTLIAADLAKKMGKPVFAVPGRATDRLSDGTNELIRNGEATMVSTAEHVIDELAKRGIGAYELGN